MTQQEAPPLYVDLDGTLIASDSLWESLALLAARRPGDLIRVPLWLLAGRSQLKAALAERVRPRASTLPYRPAVLDHVRRARKEGRRVVLATAANERIARAVADHLELFDGVLASSPEHNMKGQAKLAAIRADAGDAFEYLGDARADRPIWSASTHASVVGDADRLAGDLGVPTTSVDARGGFEWAAARRALRVYQWAKNALLVAPLLLDHRFSEPSRALSVALAFVCLCAVASATYLINDLHDMEADRQHPAKRDRPFAAGTLSIPTGVAMSAGLLAFGLGLATLALPGPAAGMIGVYTALTLTYSFVLKQRIVVDVLALASLYTVRILTGAAAAEVAVTPWMIAFAMFFFFSLGLVKRYAELLASSAPSGESLAGRGYQRGDIGLVQGMGLASGYVSILVLGLYVSHDDVTRLYPNPVLLWGVAMVMLYWISRIWFLAARGQLDDDPVLFATRDRVTYAAGGLILAIGAWASIPW